jgi:hypothetical protein
MGDHDDLPICREKLQQRRLHTQSHPGQQLEEEIKQLRKLMLKSAEEINRGKMNNKGPVETVGKLSRRETTETVEQQKQQQSSGADE